METQNQLNHQIMLSFQKVAKQRKKLEKNSSRYIITGIILSAFATFVAGFPSLLDQPIFGEWRLTCTIAALVSLAATIVTGVQNQVAKPDFLTKTSECVGRLRALLIELQSPDVDMNQVRKQYQVVLVDFADIDI